MLASVFRSSILRILRFPGFRLPAYKFRDYPISLSLCVSVVKQWLHRRNGCERHLLRIAAGFALPREE